MTDDQLDEPDFDDPAHDPIRELLSAARVDTPIPPEVAARLDAALADVTGKESPADPVVVPLRRRLAPRLLVAAAVVLVAGAGAFGLDQVLNDHGSSSSLSATSDQSTRSGGGPAPNRAPSPVPSGYALQGLADGTSLSFANGGVPVLTTADFTQQAAKLALAGVPGLTSVDRGPEVASAAPVPETAPSATGSLGSTAGGNEAGDFATQKAARSTAAKARSCPGPKLAGTTSYPIVLDGHAAVLVVHPVSNGSRLIQAWSCDGSRVLAFTTIPS